MSLLLINDPIFLFTKKKYLPENSKLLFDHSDLLIIVAGFLSNEDFLAFLLINKSTYKLIKKFSRIEIRLLKIMLGKKEDQLKMLNTKSDIITETKKKTSYNSFQLKNGFIFNQQNHFIFSNNVSTMLNIFKQQDSFKKTKKNKENAEIKSIKNDKNVRLEFGDKLENTNNRNSIQNFNLWPNPYNPLNEIQAGYLNNFKEYVKNEIIETLESPIEFFEDVVVDNLLEIRKGIKKYFI